jgi:hypothetical protein
MKILAMLKWILLQNNCQLLAILMMPNRNCKTEMDK